MRPASVALAVLVLVALAAVGNAAKKKATEAVWTSPDYGTMGIDRIAVIPVVTFDSNIQTENLVESALGPSLKGTVYRWVSGTTTRELLRAHSNGNDSLLKALRAGILKQGRLDSLEAPRVAAMLNCDAMLTVRVDLWEQHQPDWNQSGKPYTMVQLRAGLVDSLGRLAWSAYGGQTGEGSYYDPNAGTVSVKDSGLDRKPVTGQNAAPPFREVLTLLFARWAPQFPAKAGAATQGASSNTAPADSAASGK